MGIVYKGWHLILNHPIALKVLRPEFASCPEAAAQFINEGRVSAQLHGIHATRVLDLGRVENGPAVLVLEYLHGYDLRQALATDGPFSVERAVDYVLQTCEAVAEAHAQGIVHRDLKPDNLVVQKMPDGTEILKIIDFGISKWLGSIAHGGSPTQQDQSVGSPDYMAPEQMSTPDQVDERADIWSIGVVLFELLTNRAPFDGESVHAVCVKVMCAEPIAPCSLRPDIPPALERVIQRCLRKARDERYPSVRELAQELAPFTPGGAQSYARVRRLLGEPDVGLAPVSAVHVLSWRPPSIPDETALRPANETEDQEWRIPLEPLWPMALWMAAATLLIAFSLPNSRPLRAAATAAAERGEAIVQTGARNASNLAIAAADFVKSETFGARLKSYLQSAPSTIESAKPDKALRPPEAIESLPLGSSTPESRTLPPMPRGRRGGQPHMAPKGRQDAPRVLRLDHQMRQSGAGTLSTAPIETSAPTEHLSLPVGAEEVE